MKSRMIKSARLLLIAVSGLLAGCNTLKSEYYPGTKAVIKDADIERESIWTFNEEAYYVHMIGSNDFVAATLNWNEQTQTYEAESFPIVLSVLDKEEHFLSVKGDDGLYSILRAIPACDTTDTWVLYCIDGDVLKEHIHAGQVKADKKNDTYTLQGSKAEQDLYLRENYEQLFPAKAASVARMIMADKKKDK